MLIIDEYEREETRQVYVDLNNNIEVSGSDNLNILNRGISKQSRGMTIKIRKTVLAKGIIIY